MDDYDDYMVAVFGVPAAFFKSATDSLSGALQSAEDAAKVSVAILEQAGQIALVIGSEIKQLLFDLAQFSGGCKMPVLAAHAAALALEAAILAFIAGIPADLTAVGSVIGIPTQATALLTAISTAAALIPLMDAVTDCKREQMQQAVDRVNQALKDQAIHGQIDDLKKKVDDLNANIESIRKRGSSIRRESGRLRALIIKL